jgi:hypothetical protein
MIDFDLLLKSFLIIFVIMFLADVFRDAGSKR